MSSQKASIVMVGDFKQSIYGFRGSKPELMNRFVDEFKPAMTLMTHNFRSSPEIVALANDIAASIDLGDERMNESKISIATQNHLNGDVYTIHDADEFIEVLSDIKKPLHETCILARTNQAIKSVAKVLGKMNIPYYLHTEYDILKRAEVKLLMNYLSIVSHGYNKNLAIEIIKAIKGSIPMKIASGINKCTSMKDIGSMFADIKKIPELYLIYSELERGAFPSGITKLAKLLETDKKTAEQLEYSLNRFYRDLNDIRVREGFSNWMEALEELLFEAQFLEEKSSNKVQLMTVHKAKGLQWNSVIFIYDFTILDLVDHDFYNVSEEKRIVYTAVTRPKQNLVIWDLEQAKMSDLLYKGRLERMVVAAMKLEMMSSGYTRSVNDDSYED